MAKWLYLCTTLKRFQGKRLLRHLGTYIKSHCINIANEEYAFRKDILFQPTIRETQTRNDNKYWEKNIFRKR